MDTHPVWGCGRAGRGGWGRAPWAKYSLRFAHPRWLLSVFLQSGGDTSGHVEAPKDAGVQLYFLERLSLTRLFLGGWERGEGGHFFWTPSDDATARTLLGSRGTSG